MFSRTPDEIKQGLMCLVGGEELEDTCGGCAYLDTRGPCVDHVLPDVLALVEQLQATVSEKEKVIAELSGKIGQLEADNKLLQDAVDQWELVAASPGAVEDMGRENVALSKNIKWMEVERDDLKRTIQELQAEIEEYEEAADKCCYESQCNAELNRLEALCKRLKGENEQLQAERNAAARAVKKGCITCKNSCFNNPDIDCCLYVEQCHDNSKWEWCGMVEED